MSTYAKCRMTITTSVRINIPFLALVRRGVPEHSEGSWLMTVCSGFSVSINAMIIPFHLSRTYGSTC